MNKPTELVRKRGGILQDLEGRTVNAEPIGKEVRFCGYPDSDKAYSPGRFTICSVPYRKYFKDKVVHGIHDDADAYVLRGLYGDPKWITNKSVLHWEQRVQYYKLLED